jgi:hypothetical protein
MVVCECVRSISQVSSQGQSQACQGRDIELKPVSFAEMLAARKVDEARWNDPALLVLDLIQTRLYAGSSLSHRQLTNDFLKNSTSPGTQTPFFMAITVADGKEEAKAFVIQSR